jgi:hypothetical protein
LNVNRPRLDLNETGPGRGQDNPALMSAYPLNLDTPLLGPETSRQELSEARGVLYGAGLGGLVWAVVLYFLQVV